MRLRFVLGVATCSATSTAREIFRPGLGPIQVDQSESHRRKEDKDDDMGQLERGMRNLWAGISDMFRMEDADRHPTVQIETDKADDLQSEKVDITHLFGKKPGVEKTPSYGEKNGFGLAESSGMVSLVSWPLIFAPFGFFGSSMDSGPGFIRRSAIRIQQQHDHAVRKTLQVDDGDEDS